MVRFLIATVFLLLILPTGLLLSGSGYAQDRVWPSQEGIVVWGSDPAMGESGHCRLGGERFDQGEEQCLSVNGERYEAVCARTLNNTSWHRQGPCGS